MIIRTRLTLWYAGVLFVSALLMGSFSYHEFVVERERDFRRSDRRHPATALEDRRTEHEKDIAHNRIDILEILLWYLLPATVLGMVGGFFLTRQALAPISNLTQAVERINERNLGERLHVTGNGDELDRLTHVFNAMVGRLDNSFQRIRDFTLHASHELKTPLTVLSGELESALQDAGCSPAQRERLLDQLDEIQRLARIVDGLSLLTKADAGLVKLDFRPLRLDELILDAYADAQVLGKGDNVTVELRRCDALTILGDRDRLRQLLLNLADNAVKYNVPGGRVFLSLRRDGDMAEFMISNSGPGISEEERSRVFERFFRGKNRAERGVEGSGLGLSISRWIVTAHDGTIRIQSEADQMTTVVVRISLHADQAG